MFIEGNQIHNFMSSSGSGTLINYGSGSDFLTSYGSGSGSTTLPLRVCRPVVADSYHIVEQQDLDLIEVKSRIRICIKLKNWVQIWFADPQSLDSSLSRKVWINTLPSVFRMQLFEKL